MRYLLFILTLLFAVFSARAQAPLQDPSPLPIRTAEAPTNAVPSASTNSPSATKISFLMNAGIQYADAGEYEEAEQAYLRALKDDPTNADLRFRLGTLYIQTQRNAQAVEILEKLGAEFPDNAEVHNNLAWVYATGSGIKNGTLSLRHAREAILSNPTSPSLWNTLAEAYYVFGDYKKSLRSSEVAIDLLKMQNAPPEQIASFEEQRAKIQRAEAAYKLLSGLEDDE